MIHSTDHLNIMIVFARRSLILQQNPKNETYTIFDLKYVCFYSTTTTTNLWRTEDKRSHLHRLKAHDQKVYHKQSRDEIQIFKL